MLAPDALGSTAEIRLFAMAAKATGVPAERSRNAGGYLCNYLCWRATEAARSGTPRLATFIHVPAVRGPGSLRAQRTAITFDDLLEAGGAILREAVAAARAKR